MITYNTWVLLVLFAVSLAAFKLSHIKYREVRFMMIFMLVFLVLNNLFIFLFDPNQGTTLYGTRHPDVDGEHDRRPRLDRSGHRDLRHVEALGGDDHGLCFRRHGGAGLPAAGHQHRSFSGAAENAALFGHGDRSGHRIHRQP